MARYLSPEWVASFDAALRTLDLSDALAAAGQGSLAAAHGSFSIVQIVTDVPADVAGGGGHGDAEGEGGHGAGGGRSVRVVLTIEEGRPRLELDATGSGPPGTATIVLAYPHALALARGELDAADALAAGQVRVRGDLAALVAGQDVLAAATAMLGDRLEGLTDPADGQPD